LQKKHLDDLSNDIKTKSTKLAGQPQIDRILTVQNQLNSLTTLHAGKPAASRLFTYLNQLTPVSVGIASFKIDMTANTMEISGTADALNSVNKYVDTLKFTTYKTDSGAEATKAFSNIVLSSFSYSGDTTNNKPANYTISLTYDPALFDITQKVDLTVPNLVTTRSELDQPTNDLFVNSSSDSSKKGTQ
jgi:hypothetical protein